MNDQNPFQNDKSPFDYFSEMSPIFCTMNIPFSKIGPHMQSHVEQLQLGKSDRRLLIGGCMRKSYCFQVNFSNGTSSMV